MQMATKRKGEAHATVGVPDTVKLELELPVAVVQRIVALHGTGLFGHTVAEVTERLICGRLIKLSEQGWLEYWGNTEMRTIDE